MSYAISEALQAAIYSALSGDAGVNALVGGHIYDAVPSGVLPSLYVTFGEEKVRDLSSKTGAGAAHDLAVEIHSDATGFQASKGLAAAVCDALIDADLTLNRGFLTGLHFKFARARKGIDPDKRVIALTFRAFVSDV